MRILIVDDDPVMIETLALVLRREGFVVREAASSQTALTIGTEFHPDLAIVDLHLPDGSGIDLMREMRRESPRPAFVMTTGFGTTRTAVEAMRLGAVDYLEKPVDIDHLVAVVRRAAPVVLPELSDDGAADTYTAHAAARWAEMVVRVIDCPWDPKTVSRWGRWAAVSPGALRNWCRTASVAPKRSLNFARVLRAVVRQRPGVHAQNLLDTVDLRTLASLLRLGRATHVPTTELPRSVDEFLQRQSWVDDIHVLREVRRQLSARFGDSIFCDHATRATTA